MRLEEKVNEIAARLEQGELSFGQGMDDAMTESIFMVATLAGFDLYDLDDDEAWNYVISDEILAKIDSVAEVRIRERRPLPQLDRRHGDADDGAGLRPGHVSGRDPDDGLRGRVHRGSALRGDFHESGLVAPRSEDRRDRGLGLGRHPG